MKRIFAALVWAALCAPQPLAANQIVTENQLTGAPQSQWDVAGAGSSTLQGFATQFSVNHGTTISFKIQSNANSWRIDIYRLGYYQGNGARLITTISKTGTAPQPAPIVDAATGLVDAGNWTANASWAIPASAVSGVYIAHLVDNNNPTNENQIPFVVRADESHADIVFQTSDTTWQAYNGWPCGTSIPNANLYGGNGPGGGSAPGRAYKVSYNRPIATRDACGQTAAWMNYVFGAESAAIYWLERNGYDVSYISGADTARFPALLTQHKIFASTGHDEYWDGAARTNVQAARAAGVHLVFMSGNEVYWKTRWEQSIDASATPYRTLVCYKETRSSGPLDPLDSAPTWIWTGTWRDPRNSPPADGGKPENALTGTIFEVDGYRADTIQVPYEMSRLRFWRNTPNVSHAANGVTTALTPTLLGYEWDSSPDNGFDPPGAIAVSSTTVNVNNRLLDYGTMVGDGTVTHKLSLYKHASGAKVFGAGTVFWAWGLSELHDGPPAPTDPDIQQAMINLFADMGVQPSTLQSGLVPASPSTDTTAPTSTITTPLDGATFLEGQPVTISGTANDVGGRVASVEVSIDGGATSFRANGTTNWSFTWSATPGTHTIVSRATDDSLNSEAPTSTRTVTVSPNGVSIFGDANVSPKLTALDPSSVEVGLRFTAATSGSIKGVRFYKDIINIGPHSVSLWGAAGNLIATTPVPAESARGWQTALFSPAIAIAAGQTYTASYHTNGFYSAKTSYFLAPVTNGPLTALTNGGVYQYGSGAVYPSQSFNSGNYWVDVLFTPTPGVAPPVISSPTTANGVVGTPFNYQIVASENPTSYAASGLPAGLSINTSTGLIGGTPTAAGVSSVLLTATNAIGSSSISLTLSVSAATAGFRLFPTSSVPAIITVSDPSPVELGVKFSANSGGRILGVRFYKGPQNTGAHNVTLWTASGVALATATSSGETASGWQTVTFAAPPTISANTVYVASYHTNGFYSATGNFFSSPYVNSPLSAPASAASGGNGVYAYGAGGFPNNSYNATNYWVDVLFEPAPVVAPPVITSATAATAPLGQPFSYQITATNSPTSFSATGLPDGLTIEPNSGVISGAPTTAGVFNVTLGATNALGAGNATLTLNVVGPPTGESLFDTASAPAIVTVFDNNPVELGVKFTASRNGSIVGMRFYKGPQNTGVHTATLWNASGVALGTATFLNETPSGWQTVAFGAPIPVVSGVTYVASYHSDGYYSASGAFFGADHVSGSLTAPSNAASGGNGVYRYGASTAFPSNSYNATNYWVDVVFQ